MSAEDNALLEEALGLAADGYRVGPVHTPLGEMPCTCDDETIKRTPKSHGYATTVGHHVGCSCTEDLCTKDNPGKHPRTPNGIDDFTTDAEKIAGWWERWPDANLATEATTFDILDVDNPGRVPDAVRQALPGKDKVPLVRTGRGFHYLFAAADGLAMPPGKLTFGEYFHRQYAISPPSLHPNGQRYEWATSLSDVAPPAMTQKLREALFKAKATTGSRRERPDPEELLEIALTAADGLGLDPQERDDAYRMRCPVHGADAAAGHSPDALSIRAGDDMLLIYCFAGCEHTAIAAALGVSGDVDPRAARQAWFEAQPPEDLDELLGEIIALVRRYWQAGPHDYTAVALWVVFTWVASRSYYSPRLWVRSATKQSGKTRLFEAISPLVYKPLAIITPSAPAIYRSAEMGCTFLMDEVDRWLARGGDSAEAITAVINAGYKRGMSVPRVAGSDGVFEVEMFDVFTTVAFSGIGNVDDTTADRAIPIVLRKKQPGDTIERFHGRRYEDEATVIVERIEIWLHQNGDLFAEIELEGVNLVGEVSDRQEEMWGPLLALAEMAGGEWPTRARETARSLHALRYDEDVEAPHVVLLSNMRDVFAERKMPEAIASTDMREALIDEDEWRWGAVEYGRPVSLEMLSSLMRRFQVRTERWPHRSTSPKSWRRDLLEPLWSAHLPPLEAERDRGSGGHEEDSDEKEAETADGGAESGRACRDTAEIEQAKAQRVQGVQGVQGSRGEVGHTSVGWLMADAVAGIDRAAVIAVFDGEPLTKSTALELAPIPKERALVAWAELVEDGTIVQVGRRWMLADQTVGGQL